MKEKITTPGQLAGRLLVYFGAILAFLIVVAMYFPQLQSSLPVGGSPQLVLPGEFEGVPASQATVKERLAAAVAVGNYILGTIILMLPITWVYMAMKQGLGYQKNFVVSLIVLPICVSTIVLLIQESLPLAFGLAALVAAIRFRVALDDSLDAIFVFCSISVGLASGIGFIGVAYVMTVFFCFAMVILWRIDYGFNLIEDRKLQRKLEKHK